MFRLTNLLCSFVFLAMVLGLSTPVLAGPTPTPPTATPTAIPTPTPPTRTPATATPPTATPATSVPSDCATLWPVTTIDTIAKGQNPSTNRSMRHAITGHIVDPGSLGPKAHRIPVCAGSFVTVVSVFGPGPAAVRDTTLTQGTLDCTDVLGTCKGLVNVKQVIKMCSLRCQDRDTINLLPQ